MAKSKAWWCNCYVPDDPPGVADVWLLCLFHEGYDAAVRALRDRLTGATAVEVPQVPQNSTRRISGPNPARERNDRMWRDHG